MMVMETNDEIIERATGFKRMSNIRTHAGNISSALDGS